MSNVQDAGEFTVTTGIYRGNEHTFVTHRKTGKQWVSKSENTGIRFLPTLILDRIVEFFPDRTVASCDARFWMPVTKRAPAMPHSEFDALCFIGD